MTNKILIAAGAGAVIVGAILLLRGEAVPEKMILGVQWRETGTQEWHSMPLSVPAYTNVDIKWRIRNGRNALTTFTIGTVSLDRYRLYPQTLITLEPGEEADVIRADFIGWSSGTLGEETFYLAALPGEVTSVSQSDWYDADLIDSVTIQFTWY